MKKFIFAAILGLIAQVSFGQSFFRPLAKPVAYSSVKMTLTDSSTTPLPDSTFTGIRPAGPSLVYGYPGNNLMAGIGIGYEHDTYTASTGAWYNNYTAALMVYGGGAVAPTNQQAVVAIGPLVSLLNKHVSVGVAYDFISKKPIYQIGTTFDIFNVN